MEITNSIYKKSPAVGPGFSCTGQPARAGLFFGPGWPGPGFQKRPGPARAARVPTLILFEFLTVIKFI
jgi:hypothetical protein